MILRGKHSRQKNKKSLQVREAQLGRDEQFRFINDKAQSFIDEGEPVISVDGLIRTLNLSFSPKLSLISA